MVDHKGGIYRCWNNVFNSDYKVNSIFDVMETLNTLEFTKPTLDFVEKYSLENVNNKKCLKCVYCKYCQGLCPAIRKNILNGLERNIYKNDECKKIIHNRLLQLVKNIGRNANDKN